MNTGLDLSEFIFGNTSIADVRERLAQAQRQVELDFHDKVIGGRIAAKRLSDITDDLIRWGFSGILNQNPTTHPVALLALGGYGRQAMFIHSDIDLQILCTKAGQQDVAQITEQLLYWMWDLKLKVGYATRTISETLKLVRSDVTVATSVLDSRLVDGDQKLFTELRRILAKKYFSKCVDEFIKKLVDEQQSRHARYGDTVYLLEPNVKYGRGGLRDLQTAAWCVNVRYGIDSLAGLVKTGRMRTKDRKELAAARDFLWDVRHCLQFASRRKNDQLTFEYQDQIAEHFEFVPGKGLNVEQFMQRYYRLAKTVQSRSGIWIERCLYKNAGFHRRGSRRAIDENYRCYAGKLNINDPLLFEKQPREVVHVFKVALDEQLQLHPFTKQQVVANCGRIDDALRRDPGLSDDFFAVLCAPDDGQLLLMMHELGVLNQYLPEFERITGRTQHDVYHIYTVDIHTIRAVSKLKALAAGDLDHLWPLPRRLFLSISDTRSLFLATLLHDVGKGYGSGHSERGALLVADIAARFGLDLSIADEIRFLIRRHLYMVLTAQKHDLSDVVLLRRFAREIGSPELLSKLYLLTMVDMSTTGPRLKEDWRDAMLQELYFKAHQLLTKGLDLWNDPQKEVYRCKEAVTNLMFPEHPGENYKLLKPIDTFFGMLPTRYFRATSPEQIVAHIDIARRLKTVPTTLDWQPLEQAGLFRVTVGKREDRPGLLADISGVMAAFGLNILGAQIHSLENGMIIDVFNVQDPHHRTFGAENSVDDFERTLKQTLAGEQPAAELLALRRPVRAQLKRFAPRVMSQVVIDNDVSAQYTVIEVHAADEIGTLFRITSAFKHLELTIHLAKISSKGNKVLDVFYVDTLDGRKIRDKSQKTHVRKTLLAAVATAKHAATPGVQLA